MGSISSLSCLASALLIILVVFPSNSTGADPYDCSKIQNVCTVCDSMKASDLMHIECPESPNSSSTYFIIQVFPNKFQMKIDCVKNSDSPTNFSLLPHLGHLEIKWLVFQSCSLPSKPIRHILNDIGLASHVRSISFTIAQNATTLNKMHMKGLHNITSFKLDISNAIHLQDDLFEDVTNLQSLFLKGSEIHLYPNSFQLLTQLNTLELSRSKLYNFQSDIFKDLSLLKSLSMWHLKFDEMINITSDTFDGLANLTSLDMHGNNLDNLPSDAFSKLTKLVHIHLAQNNLMSLPEGLFAYNSKLNSISLNDNRNLSNLPNGLLSNLTSLNDVQLKKCAFEYLPESLFWGSTNITRIILESNRLKNISKDLFRDQNNLLELNLQNNNISHIDDEAFKTLATLKILNLNQNKMINISSVIFRNLGSLEELQISHNDLQEIDREAFFRIKKVTKINMSHNKLTLMEERLQYVDGILNSPFQTLHQLETLDLSHNLISEIFNDWTSILVRLKDLRLNYNKISKVQFADLQFLSKNILINLTNNNITQIYFDDEIISSLDVDDLNPRDPSNVHIEMANNPISCDCLTYNFVRYLRNELPKIKNYFTVIDSNKLECSSPDLLKNTMVMKVDPYNLYCPMYYSDSNQTNCPNNCVCLVRGHDNHSIANCSTSNIILPIKLPRNVKYTEIWIQNNALRNLSNVFYDKSITNHMKMLNVSYNNLTQISINDIPERIEILDLSHNYISYIDSSVIDVLTNKTTLKDIRLSDNPFECNCDNLPLITFIRNNYKKIGDQNSIKCDDGIPIADIAIAQLCGTPSVIIVSSVTIAVSGIIIGILAALYYKYQQEIKVWLYARRLCLWCITEKEIDKDKIYDAFISFSHKDEDFVVNKLLPELESGPHPFKICIHLRDWMVGEYIAAQIARSVQDSRRTVVVLSPNFVNSVWGTTEFRLAHSRALKEGRARVIIILYGDIATDEIADEELKLYLSTNTYVKWGDPLFWDKLKYALPHKQYNKQLMPIHVSSKKGFDDKLELIHPTTPGTPPGQNTPPAHQAHTNPLMNHVNSIPNGVKPTNYYNGTITMNGLKVNGNAKHSDV